MQYVYLYADNSPLRSSDHCSECGGEQYEGMTGRLFHVHIIQLNEDGTIHHAHNTDICQGCIDGIRSLSEKKRKKGKKSLAPKTTTHKDARPVKRLLGSELGLSEYAKDWPFVLEINGRKVSRACSISQWTSDPCSDYGYVYDNDTNVYFIFEDTN
jgi:hypothetical protein